MRTVLKAVLVALWLAAVARADEPPADIPALVRRLGSDDFAVRAAAAARLHEMGTAAEAALRAAANHPDPEVRLAVGQLLARIDSDRHRMRMAAFDAAFTDFPMIDALWYDTARKVYSPWDGLSRLLYARYKPYIAAADSDPADWRPYSRYRAATRRAFREAYESGIPLWTLEALAAEMYRRDAVYLDEERREYERLLANPPSPAWEPYPQPLIWRVPAGFPEWMQFRCYDRAGLAHALSRFPR